MGEVLHGSLLQLLLEHCDFLNIDILQGSVATCLRCGGIFKYALVANLLVSLPVKEFWKSVNIWGSYGQEFGVLFFSETQCTRVAPVCFVISSVCLQPVRRSCVFSVSLCIHLGSCGVIARVCWYYVHTFTVSTTVCMGFIQCCRMVYLFAGLETVWRTGADENWSTVSSPTGRTCKSLRRQCRSTACR